MYVCENRKQQVPRENVCDGVNNCADESDEKYCNRPFTQLPSTAAASFPLVQFHLEEDESSDMNSNHISDPKQIEQIPESNLLNEQKQLQIDLTTQQPTEIATFVPEQNYQNVQETQLMNKVTETPANFQQNLPRNKLIETTNQTQQVFENQKEQFGQQTSDEQQQPKLEMEKNEMNDYDEENLENYKVLETTTNMKPLTSLKPELFTTTITSNYEQKGLQKSQIIQPNPSPEEMLLRGMNIPLKKSPLQNPWQPPKTGAATKIGSSYENPEEENTSLLPNKTEKPYENDKLNEENKIRSEDERKILRQLTEKYGTNATNILKHIEYLLHVDDQNESVNKVNTKMMHDPNQFETTTLNNQNSTTARIVFRHLPTKR